MSLSLTTRCPFHTASFSSSFPSLMASPHPILPGDPWPCGPGVESKESQPVRRNLPFPVLATWPLDGCCCGRPSAGQWGWSAALLPLSNATRVLERPAGEGLRQVRPPGSLLSLSTSWQNWSFQGITSTFDERKSSLFMSTASSGSTISWYNFRCATFPKVSELAHWILV